MKTLKQVRADIDRLYWMDTDILKYLYQISSKDLKLVLGYESYCNDESGFIYDERDAIVGRHELEDTELMITIERELNRRSGGTKHIPRCPQCGKQSFDPYLEFCSPECYGSWVESEESIPF